MAGYSNNGGYQQNGFNGGQQGFNGAPQGGYNNAPQQGGQQRSFDFNKVHNWNVRVFGVKPTRKGFYLNCGLSGKKKPDGSYAKQMFVSVFVGQNCDCPRDINWDKLDISVDGTFSVDEWVQQNGNVIPQYNIYAEKITIRQRENRQGGYQQQGYNNAPQQGYNSAPQGGYNNAPQQGFNGVGTGIADLKYTVAAEECATRTNSTQNTQGILNAINGGIQSIKDQLCQDKIDAKNDEIATLRQQIAMKDLAASQVAQNAFIQQGFSNEVDALYTRLSNCPVPSTPVYGRTPIFSCNNGCGCNGGFAG